MAEPRYGEERKQMGSIVGDRPKISVIMGVYNGADRVDEAIASIRVQTFTDWEFIICDMRLQIIPGRSWLSGARSIPGSFQSVMRRI